MSTARRRLAPRPPETPALFSAEALERSALAWPAWFVGGTARQRGFVGRGLHPLGMPLRTPPDPKARCGTCAELRRARQGFLKCSTMHTHGPATDVRLKWPACILFSPRNP